MREAVDNSRNKRISRSLVEASSSFKFLWRPVQFYRPS